jgi:hypothetical protein
VSGERASQIRALSKALVAIVPQAATVALPWATKLYDEHNIRVGGSPADDAETVPAQHHTDKLSHDGWEWLSKHDPAMAERIAGAQTEAERAALRAELAPKIPRELVDAARQLEALEHDVTE